MAKSKLSLDVDSPDKVANILREAAQSYYDSAGDIEAGWQEKAPARPWLHIAAILEQAADEIDETDLTEPLDDDDDDDDYEDEDE